MGMGGDPEQISTRILLSFLLMYSGQKRAVKLAMQKRTK